MADAPTDLAELIRRQDLLLEQARKLGRELAETVERLMRSEERAAYAEQRLADATGQRP